MRRSRSMHVRGLPVAAFVMAWSACVSALLQAPVAPSLAAEPPRGADAAAEAAGAGQGAGQAAELSVVDALAFHPDGKTLAVAGCARRESETRVPVVTFRDPRTGARSAMPWSPEGPVTELAYSPTGKLLAAAVDKMVLVWDVDSGKVVRQLAAGETPVAAIGFSPQDGGLASVTGAWGKPGRLTLWDPQAGKLLRAVNGPPAQRSSIRFSQDGTVLAVEYWADAYEVRVYETRTLAVIRTFTREQDQFDAADLSPQGNVLAVARREQLRLLDVKTGELKRELALGGNAEHPARLMSVIYSPDGTTIATPVDLGKRLPSGMVVFWDLKSGARVAGAERPWGRITRFVFSPRGESLAYGSGSAVHLLDPQTGEQRK